jgi:hypothetical protein
MKTKWCEQGCYEPCNWCYELNGTHGHLVRWVYNVLRVASDLRRKLRGEPPSDFRRNCLCLSCLRS